MSDRFYKFIWLTWRFPFSMSGRPVLLGMESVPRTGACILAATHTSYYDVPLLAYHTPRMLDFVSVTEQFRKPILRWFYGSMNAFPLDRSRADPKTVRVVLDRLERGRAILIFPEGGIKTEDQSAVRTGKIRPGLGRIAKLARVPIIPVAIVNSGAYLKMGAWAPLKRVRYGIAYGEPIPPGDDPAELERRFIEGLRRAHDELTAALAAKKR
jgi:1-acyl-sn-glycerol-3-phosphate acyltransferase